MVTLAHCDSYESKQVEEKMHFVLQNSGILTSFTRNAKILVKPNLLRAEALACTHAQVVRALCICLQDAGIKVIVRDSSAFGTAHTVAEHIGLSAALKPLGLTVQEFSKPVPLTLPQDFGTWHIGQEALECDAIISVPKLKAHRQMRLSLAVKNLFGCICGMRKALAHFKQGRSVDIFCQSILALYAALPKTAAVLDGIHAMHKTGPSDGEVYPLYCLGASIHAEALDTVIYTMFHMKTEQVPLWENAQKNQNPAAFAENIIYSDLKPDVFDRANFEIPQRLMHVSFQPHRLLMSYAQRILSRFF